jgi:hypothetical protein
VVKQRPSSIDRRLRHVAGDTEPGFDEDCIVSVAPVSLSGVMKGHNAGGVTVGSRQPWV